MSLRNTLSVKIGWALVSLAAVVFAANLCRAQDARGSISGRVMDPLGAVIPQASVAVTNVDTNLVSRTATNDTGYFEANLLNPGRYGIAVEAQGFRKSLRSGIELSVASRVNLEIQMEVGDVSQSIEVKAEAPLLDTASASGGRVIDNRQIMELPLGDMNPFALSAMATGMVLTGLPEQRRAFDSSGASAYRTMGGVGQNEYTIDGAPVTGTDRRVGYVPTPDSVAEFKLETSPFDASYGHTSGAVINVMTKSGTNAYRGSIYEQHWQQRWNAMRHFTRLTWEDAVRNGKRNPNDPKQESGRSNTFGLALGGPVRIPKVYQGTDKFFFFANYHGMYERRQETKDDQVNKTVPKMAWRQGDFSDLLAVDAVKYTVYDARSARVEGGRVVRTPFPGNKGVPILNPVYKYYEPLYPKPNDVSGLVTREGINNYRANMMSKNWDYNQFVNRYDYNISDRHRLFGSWYWSHAFRDAYDWTYETMPGLHSAGLIRANKGGAGGYVWTMSSNTLLDIGVNWTRFNEGDPAYTPAQTAFTPSQVGLPAYMDAKAGAFHTLPMMTIGGIQSIGGKYPNITTRGTTSELKAQMTTIVGNHSLKYGWQERRYWRTTAGAGMSSGSFTFNQNYMRQSDSTSTASDLGLGWAAFMMGLPSGASIDTNDTAYWTTRWRGLYINEDWRLTRKLQLNLGLRYEREAGTTERFNRGLAGGFLFDYKPAFAGLAEAAYATSALPEMPASQFKVLGGTQYLGQPNKTYTDGTHHLLPRVGLAFQVSPRMVLRTGYGWYYDTFNVNNDVPSMDGFSQPTSTTITNDQGLTLCCGAGAAGGLAANRNPMVDPFPVRSSGTRFDTPYGNSLGPLIRQGRGFTFVPRNYSPASQQRWRVSLQREITKNTVLDVSYNGSYSKVPVTQRIDYLPEQNWAVGNTRNQAVDDRLNRTVSNPFNIRNLAALQTSDPKTYAYLNTQGFFTGTTVRTHQLLRTFPNINGLYGLRPGVDIADSRGGARYHDMELRLERRFSRGLQTALMYTGATGEIQNTYRNEFDAAPSWQLTDNIRPHRLIWTAIWELPFGKGRRLAQSGPLRHLLGGWQISGIHERQSGPSTAWSNRFFYGDLNNIASLFNQEDAHSKNIHVWFDPSISYRGTGAIPQGFQGFEGRAAQQPGTFHVRVFPTRLGSLRADGIRNWDVKLRRRFQITERLGASFSVDALNLTNHTTFDVPNTTPTDLAFGTLTGQLGTSRVIQFHLRLTF
jgi:hypothetical protein